MRMRVPFAVTPLLFATTLIAQSSWSPPVLQTALNSTASDAGPNLSFDGLTLYFASFRSGNWELYASTRAFPGDTWSSPVLLPELGGSGVEDQPFLAIGNQEVYFSSNRAGGAGGFDILRSTRASPAVPWSPPQHVTELNSSGSESAFSVTADGLEAYLLSTGFGAPAAPNNAIFRATRTSTALPFGTPTLVAELSTTNTHRDCEIAPDGLSIVYTQFISPRLKVLFAARPDRSSPFSTPVVWAEFDTVGTVQGVYSFTRSATGDEAFLAVGFATAAGSQEIMTTRRSMPYGSGCGGAAPLELQSTAPVLGANWAFTTTNVDAVSPVAITYFGLNSTSIPLDSLGAVGCFASVDSIVSSLTSANVGGVAQLGVPVPSTPSLAGFTLRAQSACLTLGNALGIYTSNGVFGTLGL